MILSVPLEFPWCLGIGAWSFPDEAERQSFKLQAPSFRETPSAKFQMRPLLWFEAWSFPGAWGVGAWSFPVVPSFRQRGELHDLRVQIVPLNNLQSPVMQEALQVIPHRASAPRNTRHTRQYSIFPRISRIPRFESLLLADQAGPREKLLTPKSPMRTASLRSLRSLRLNQIGPVVRAGPEFRKVT